MTAITLSDAERTACEVWSRCMGYHPVSYWNPGKQAEHRERRSFRLPDLNRQRTQTDKRPGIHEEESE